MAGEAGMTDEGPTSSAAPMGGAWRWWLAAFLLVLSLAIIVGLLVAQRGWMGNRQRAVTQPAASARIVELSAMPDMAAPVEFITVTADRALAINAARPFSSAPLVAAKPFGYRGTGPDRERARDCLATAAFYEAGTDMAGQLSVMQVVLNRVRHPAFPKSVCGVVFQGAERATGCQFSFTCDGSMSRRAPTPAMWREAVARADAMLIGKVDPSVGLATHYHTDWVLPVWSESLDKIARVGTHLFFRWPGWWGSSAPFSMRSVEQVEPQIAQMTPLSAAHAPVLAVGTSGSDADVTLKGGHADRGAPSTPDPAQRFVESGEKADWRGHRIVRSSADGRTWLVQLKGDAAPGSYALTALSVCRDRPTCQMVGWKEGEAVPKDWAGLQARMRSATFIYDRSGTGERLRWDCRVASRPDPAQCI